MANSVKIKLVSPSAKDELDKLFGKSISEIKPSSRYASEGDVIAEPPFDPYALAKVPDKSDLVSANIDAIEQNAVGLGWVVSALLDADGSEKEIETQRKAVRKLFEDPNEDYETFTDIAKRVIRDKETFGYGFLEVIRDRKGNIKSVYHVDAKNIRVRKDLIDAETGQVEKRGYVQIDEKTKDVLVYYKNFGDSRQMNRMTGKYSSDVPFESQATELIPFHNPKRHSQYYGSPRYLPAELAITGNVYAQESNNSRFRNNLIPDKAIIVSNGQVVSGEQDLRSYFNENFKGAENRGKALLIEVEGFESDSLAPNSKLENAHVQVIDLNNWKDADFLKYQENNDSRIRRVWRLSPIITGDVADVNRATALVAKEIAEEQVFNPIRMEFEVVINQTIVRDIIQNTLKIKQVKVALKFNKVRVVDPEFQLKKAEMASKEKIASLNEIREMIGLKPVEHEIADIPLMLVEYEERKKIIDTLSQENKSVKGEFDIKTLLNKKQETVLDVLHNALRRKYSE